MSQEANEVTLGAHLAAETKHDMAGTLKTLHPECVFVDGPLGLRLKGRTGARLHYEMWWQGFGVTLDGGTLHWVDDDLLIGDSTFVGRHKGEFAGLAATGRELRLPFVVFVTFRDGLLAGERFIYDLNSMLHQLGQPAFTPATTVQRAASLRTTRGRGEETRTLGAEHVGGLGGLVAEHVARHEDPR